MRHPELAKQSSLFCGIFSLSARDVAISVPAAWTTGHHQCNTKEFFDFCFDVKFQKSVRERIECGVCNLE